MAKYKVGDEVRVRKDLECGKRYYNEDGITSDTVVIDMLEFAGKWCTVESITHKGKYELKDMPKWAWVDDMFDADTKVEVTGESPLVEKHKNICRCLNDLYAKKNADYGNSFHDSFLEEGWAMPRIRLGDKMNRLKSLTKNGKQEVKDESIRDTLLDLANYAIMTVMELDAQH